MHNTTFTITFEPFGECAPENITAVYGTNITLPDCESAEVVFYGWFEDANNTILFDRNTMPGRDVTVHGVYVPAEYLKFCEFSAGWCSPVDCINPCSGLCGASCDAAGHITGISAESKGLASLDGEVVSSFTHLEELSLAGNELTDLPASLAELRSLRALSLSGNGVETIPIAVFSLVSLTSLYLTKTTLSINYFTLFLIFLFSGLSLTTTLRTSRPTSLPFRISQSCKT